MARFVLENMLSLALVRLRQTLPGSTEERELIDALLAQSPEEATDTLSNRMAQDKPTPSMLSSSYANPLLAANRSMVSGQRGPKEGRFAFLGVVAGLSSPQEVPGFPGMAEESAFFLSRITRHLGEELEKREVKLRNMVAH